MGYQDAIIIIYGEAIRLKAKQDLVDKSNKYDIGEDALINANVHNYMKCKAN